MAGDDEMIFTAPREMLEDLMSGLRHVNSAGSRLPHGYAFMPEGQLSDSYEKIGKTIGYI